MAITTVGLDTSKSWFQLHCVDENGELVLRENFHAARFIRSLRIFRDAWSVWKLEAALTTGFESCRSLVTMSS